MPACLVVSQRKGIGRRGAKFPNMTRVGRRLVGMCSWPSKRRAVGGRQSTPTCKAEGQLFVVWGHLSLLVWLRGLHKDRFCVPLVCLACRTNDRYRRYAAYGHVFIRDGQDSFVTSFASALGCQGLSRRQGIRLFNRLLNAFFSRGVVLIFQGFNQDGPNRVLRRSRSKSIRFVVDRRISPLTNVNRDCDLQDTSGGDAYRYRYLSCHRIGVTHAQQGISRRVVRVSPNYVPSRLFRHVTHRAPTPWDNLIKVSGRASEGRFRTVLLSEGGRVTSICLLDMKTNVFRLGRLERKEARGINVR